MEVTLVRHGTTELNKKGYYQGSSVNYPLSEEGREYAEDVAEIFNRHEYDVAFVSPLLRAVQTAEILGRDAIKFVSDERIQEQDFGKIDGQAPDELKKAHPDAFDYRGLSTDKLPEYVEGVETFDSMFARVADFFTMLKKDYPDKRVLLVCHGVIIRVIAAYLLETSVDKFDQVKNVALTRFHLDENDKFDARMVYYNRTIV